MKYYSNKELKGEIKETTWKKDTVKTQDKENLILYFGFVDPNRTTHSVYITKEEINVTLDNLYFLHPHVEVGKARLTEKEKEEIKVLVESLKGKTFKARSNIGLEYPHTVARFYNDNNYLTIANNEEIEEILNCIIGNIRENHPEVSGEKEKQEDQNQMRIITELEEFRAMADREPEENIVNVTLQKIKK